MSVFNPIIVLNSKVAQIARSGLGRKALVIIQFIISIVLIIVTLNIFTQIKFLATAKTGFDKKNILILPVSRTAVSRKYETFKQELLQNPNVVSVTAMDDILGVAHNTRIQT